MNIGSVPSAAAGGAEATQMQVAVAQKQQKTSDVEGKEALSLIQSASPPGTGAIVNRTA